MDDTRDSHGFEEYGLPIGAPDGTLPEPVKGRTWEQEVERAFFANRSKRRRTTA